MSVIVNIDLTVAVPLETVAAILSTHSPANTNVALPQVNTNQAITAAVKALPYDIKPKPAGINLWVRTLTGKTIPINNIASNAKATELCSRIQDKEGTPPVQQRLIFAGKLLNAYDENENESLDMSLDEVSSPDVEANLTVSNLETLSRPV